MLDPAFGAKAQRGRVRRGNDLGPGAEDELRDRWRLDHLLNRRGRRGTHGRFHHLPGKRRVAAVTAGQKLARVVLDQAGAVGADAVTGGTERIVVRDHAADRGQDIADVLGKAGGVLREAGISHGDPRRSGHQSRPIARKTRSRLSPCLLV